MASVTAGRLLVDQTLVCEAARLLRGGRDDSGSGLRDAERLAQLSLLLDAVLLYRRLDVLRSDLPRDADRLELRRAMVDTRVLRELDVSEYAAPIARELGTFLARVGLDARSGADLSHLVAERDLIAVLRAALEGGDPTGFSLGGACGVLSGLWSGSDQDMTSGPVDVARAVADPITTMGLRLVSDLEGGLSGAPRPEGTSQLRTLMYWRISSHLNLPFYPSFQRLPQYYAVTEAVRAATQDVVYSAVAESFKATIDEVYEGDDPLPIYLPPSLSLFLDRMRRTRDVREALGSLRTEFRPLRLALARLQEETSRATSLRELSVARARFNRILADLRTSHQPEATTAVGQALDLAPAVAMTLANPLDAAGYAERIVNTPREWIRRWWLRRPYRLVFRLRDRLLEIQDYDRLLVEGAGIQVSESDLAEFVRQYDDYLSRFPSYGPARRPTGGS